MSSLLCRDGRDSPIRFALISACAFVVYFLAMAVVADSGSWLASVITLLLMVCVLLVTTLGWLRRINDIGRPKSWCVLPALFWLQFCLIQWLWHGTVLALASTAALVMISVPGMLVPASERTAPFRPGKEGELGYSGPEQQNKKRGRARPSQTANTRPSSRVEPSINHSDPAESTFSPSAHPGFGDWDTLPRREDRWWHQAVSQLVPVIRQYQRPLLSLFSALLLTLLVIVAWPETTDDGSEPQKLADEVSSESIDSADGFEHRLPMDDNYSLLMEKEGVTIEWPGDPSDLGEIWSFATAAGDADCQEAKFDNGEGFRPYLVEVKPGDKYYAHFSPLDTGPLIYNIGRANQFRLCGYRFSLKGTLDKLRGHQAFARYSRSPDG